MPITRWLAVWVIAGVLALGVVAPADAQQPVRVPSVSSIPNDSDIFSGGGFGANETLSSWITAPDTAVTRLPILNADNNGVFIESVSFPGTGYYQVTV